MEDMKRMKLCESLCCSSSTTFSPCCSVSKSPSTVSKETVQQTTLNSSKNAHGYNHAIKYFWHTFTSFVDAQVLIEWKYIRVQGLHNVSDVVQ